MTPAYIKPNQSHFSQVVNNDQRPFIRDFLGKKIRTERQRIFPIREHFILF